MHVAHAVLAECIVEFIVGGYDHRNGAYIWLRVSMGGLWGEHVVQVWTIQPM